MNLTNQVQLIGNLGKDPEYKELESGTKVVNFSLATTDFHKDNAGKKVTETDWHNCVAWGATAEIISKYTKKGSKILLSGIIKYDKYEKEGEKRTITKIKVNKIMLLDRKISSENQNNNNQEFESKGEESHFDDLPY